MCQTGANSPHGDSVLSYLLYSFTCSLGKDFSGPSDSSHQCQHAAKMSTQFGLAITDFWDGEHKSVISDHGDYPNSKQARNSSDEMAYMQMTYTVFSICGIHMWPAQRCSVSHTDMSIFWTTGISPARSVPLWV